MIIDCISDLHGFYPKLAGGDLLIVAGDLTATDEMGQHIQFFEWLNSQDYEKKVVIAGNHDNVAEKAYPLYDMMRARANGWEYLCDSGTEFEGLKIWGSPWTKTFPGMNQKCKAFTFDTEEELGEKFAMIPSDTDILITHSPPHGMMDQTINGSYVGSSSLQWLLYTEKIKPKLCIWGHIHEAYGYIPQIIDFSNAQCANASHVNELYQPVNKPIRVIL